MRCSSFWLSSLVCAAVSGVAPTHLFRAGRLRQLPILRLRELIPKVPPARHPRGHLIPQCADRRRRELDADEENVNH
jgi:hypothetical protein